VPLEQGLADYAYWIRHGGQAVELRATD
jgi:hypothetical protein